jgi:hypothetical protein
MLIFADVCNEFVWDGDGGLEKICGVYVTSASRWSTSNASKYPKWMQLGGKGLHFLLEMHPLASLRRLLVLKP